MRINYYKNFIRTTNKPFSLKHKFMNKYDISQTKYFDEELILVNENDEMVKGISKFDGKILFIKPT
jgi:hypothetical protein